MWDSLTSRRTHKILTDLKDILPKTGFLDIWKDLRIEYDVSNSILGTTKYLGIKVKMAQVSSKFQHTHMLVYAFVNALQESSQYRVSLHKNTFLEAMI